MTTRMTIQELRKAQKRPPKYGNKKTIVDGIEFSSRREAAYYMKLKLLLAAGAIENIERQIPYELNGGGSFSYKYVADFRFWDKTTAQIMVVDVKGFKTKEFKKKQRHSFEEAYKHYSIRAA